MKSSYLNKYDRQSNDIGTKISAIHKFIFDFNTYLGSKFNIFSIICRKLQFLEAILDFVPQKKMLNTYSLAYIRFGFSTSKQTRNSKKTLYIMKNKVLWPLAWTKCKFFKKLLYSTLAFLSWNHLLCSLYFGVLSEK